MIDNQNRMKWTDSHEIKALLIYKKIKKELNKDKLFPKNKINSVLMKCQNTLSLETEGKEGKSRVSQRHQKIWNKYKDYSIEELRQEIERFRVT